jgi:hypothetical protein
MRDDEPEQKALFEIEGPDEEGCVWICSVKPTDDKDWWCQNLGSREKVTEVLSQWLASIDLDEREDAHLFAPEMEPGEAEKRDAKRARKLARPKDHREEGGQG